MLKKFAPLLALVILFFSSQVSAEVKIIDKEGRYTADLKLQENLDVITEHAREDALRQAAEEAGIFVKSSSVMINNSELIDKVEVIAATIMEILEEDTFPEVEGKNITVVCRIKAKVDTDRIDPAQILGSQQQLQTIEEKNKIVAEKDAEIAKWKSLYESAVSEKQKLEIKTEFDNSQKQFLIAKYERDLNIFDFDTQINWQTVYETSQKLSELDALNPTAFRAAIYYYREQGDLKTAMDYCQRILKTNCPADTAIEAYTQLGDMYYNEFNDKNNAKKFINAGIALVKKTYSKAEIEKFVNGTNFEISMSEPVGKTNTIRELYILKSDIENVNPKFKSITKVTEKIVNGKSTDSDLVENRIYNINYRTDW